MKVLFLVADRAQVSCRFRVLQYLPYLEARGVAACVGDLHASATERRRLVATADEFDAVVVHRAFLSWRELRALRRRGRPYVFDFDDAIMFRDSAAPRHASWQRLLRWRRMVRQARHVVAGNSYLADWTRRQQRRVTIIPTTVDMADYQLARPQPTDAVVGWMGTRVNLMYLRALAAPLARVAQRNPAMRLKVVSDGSVSFTDVPVIAKPWARADEVDDVRSFAVGIMPLRDDAWARGKCALKLLQYMAAGVPVVCSPVGANTAIVRHGVNGYFASTDTEWVTHIETLLRTPALREEIGCAGRSTVAARFTTAGHVDEWLAVLGRDE